MRQVQITLQNEVYNRLDNLINNEWHTEGNGTTNTNGVIEFNGFYGIYNIIIPSLGFHLTINTMNGESTNLELIIP